MTNKTIMALGLLVVAAGAGAAEGPTEDQVRDAIERQRVAAEQANFENWSAGFDEDTAIILDMDPLPERGQREMNLDTFRQVAPLGIAGLENPSVRATVESIQPMADSDDLQAIYVIALESDLLGMRMEEVTRVKAVFALKSGQLVLRRYEENVLRAGPIKAAAAQ